MKTALAAVLAVAALATAAYADVPATGETSGTLMYNQGTTVAPRYQPTPLFLLGGVQFEIWTPVAPPYNAAANRNLAGRPLW